MKNSNVENNPLQFLNNLKQKRTFILAMLLQPCPVSVALQVGGSNIAFAND